MATGEARAQTAGRQSPERVRSRRDASSLVGVARSGREVATGGRGFGWLEGSHRRGASSAAAAWHIDGRREHKRRWECGCGARPPLAVPGEQHARGNGGGGCRSVGERTNRGRKKRALWSYHLG
jgi:hypothetical protein